MPTTPIQQLATKTEFDVFGVKPTRHNEPDATIDAHLRAASGIILAALEPYARLPLTEWGEDLVLHVCAIAAWNLRGVIGFDPHDSEFEALKTRYQEAMDYVALIREKKAPPVGVVDSSDYTAVDPETGETADRQANAPRVHGYARRNYTEF